MIIEYIINGQIKRTEESCADIEVQLSEKKNGLTATVTAKADIELIRAVNPYSFKVYKKDLYFFNGYQSWTDTKEFYPNEKERNVLNLPEKLLNQYAFQNYGDATFYEYGKDRQHGFDVFWSKGNTDRFVYNLNEGAYLIIELLKKKDTLNLISDVKGKTLKAGESFKIFDYGYYESYMDGVKAFEKAFPKKPIEKLLGYTSWYNYYQDINAEIIDRDLSALDKRFNLFQIDDGYETFVGDWLDVDKNKFPNGLDGYADKIHQKGFTAGIWLAPFIAEEKSKLFIEHKELFKKDENGNCIKCGCNWSGFYALDVYNPEAREYIRKCLKHYVKAGFDFFKLDFLYCAHLPEYKGKTRCEVASDSYKFLREVLGDKLILGCGAMIYNSANVFDYLRIGPDVSLKFDDVWYMRFMHRERVSTKVTLQNTIYRSFADGRFFGNDPDVFLLRDDNILLSRKQKQAMITIDALFGTLMMTSDNIKDYDEDKKETLQKALKLFYEAKEPSFARKGCHIEISYSIGGVRYNFRYNAKKGVIDG